MRHATQPAQPSTAASSPTATPNNPDVASISLAIILPIMLLLSLVAHKRYRFVQRQRQISLLEKLWLLNCEETKS